MKRRSGPPSSQSSMRYGEENRRHHSINSCFTMGRNNVPSSTCSASGRRDEETWHTGKETWHTSRTQYVPVNMAPIGYSMLPSYGEKKIPRSTRWGPPTHQSIGNEVSPFQAQYRTSTYPNARLEPNSNINSSLGTSNIISQHVNEAEKETP